MNDDTRTPVDVLTGFLGSGKTTLLNRMLADPDLGEVAVLINEYGEVAIDHLLVEKIDERTSVLANGCVCCSVREDLLDALEDLHRRRARGEIPAFSRVLVETTGLADPAPLITSLNTHPALRHQFRPGGTIATLDVLHAERQLEAHGESRKQIAMADLVHLTKTDLAPATRVEAARQAVKALNPLADCHVPGAEWAGAVELVQRADLGRAASRQALFERLAQPVPAGKGHHRHPHSDVDVVAVDSPGCIDWVAFGVWLSLLVHTHGDDLLRIKCVLDVEPDGLPVVIHGVHHHIHPPRHLSHRPDGFTGSRIVIFSRGLDAARIEASLQSVMERAARLAA